MDAAMDRSSRYKASELLCLRRRSRLEVVRVAIAVVLVGIAAVVARVAQIAVRVLVVARVVDHRRVRVRRQQRRSQVRWVR